jgi:hypothetical protein
MTTSSPPDIAPPRIYRIAHGHDGRLILRADTRPLGRGFEVEGVPHQVRWTTVAAILARVTVVKPHGAGVARLRWDQRVGARTGAVIRAERGLYG